MPSPSSSLATLRPDLLGSFRAYDIDMAIAGFGALQIAPAIEVSVQAGNFGKIPIEQLIKRRDSKRAPGSGYNRGSFKFDPAPFNCEEHGLEEPVDARQAKMYADYFDAEEVSAQRARWGVMANHESRVCALCSDTSVWTGASLTTAVGTAWTNLSGSDPVADVAGAVLTMRNAGGLVPNALVVSWARFQKLKDNEVVIPRINHGSNAPRDPGRRDVTAKALASVFDLDFVIVMGGIKDGAAEGQPFVASSLWPDDRAMVCRVAVTKDPREACIARTFHWSEDGSTIGGTMETYWEEQTRGDVVRCRMDTDEIRMHVQAGHLLTNV